MRRNIAQSQTHTTSEVARLCPTLCDPMDSSLPGSSIHGIFQARVLKWLAISFSRGSSWPRDWTQVSCIASRCVTIWAPRHTNQSSTVWSLLALGLMLLLPSVSLPLHLTPWPWHIKHQPTWEIWLPQMWHVLSGLCGSMFHALASQVLQLPSPAKFYPCLKAQLKCQLFQEVFYQPELTTFPSCSPCTLLTALFLYLFLL